MPPLFTLIAKPRLFLAASMVILAAVVALQTSRLSHARAQLSDARAALIDPLTKRPWKVEAAQRLGELETCAQARGGLEQSLRRQNAAIAAIEQEGARVSARASASAARARKAAAGARGRATEVLAAERGADACRSADALILDSLAG